MPSVTHSPNVRPIELPLQKYNECALSKMENCKCTQFWCHSLCLCMGTLLQCTLKDLVDFCKNTHVLWNPYTCPHNRQMLGNVKYDTVHNLAIIFIFPLGCTIHRSLQKRLKRSFHCIWKEVDKEIRRAVRKFPEFPCRWRTSYKIVHTLLWWVGQHVCSQAQQVWTGFNVQCRYCSIWIICECWSFSAMSLQRCCLHCSKFTVILH
jgi:hypothetical protein